MPSQSILYSQNFLKDPCLVASLLERSGISCADTVYEIGPGRGIITAQLARRCKRVVAIEKDPDLACRLQRLFAGTPNVVIRPGDFLHYPLPYHSYKVFANIPFNITAAIVTRLTTAGYPPEDAYLVMQREAAEMFMGRPRESLRTILLKPWFEVEIVHQFQRKDFIPAPRVDVVMLRLRKRGPPLVRGSEKQRFRDFVVHVFTAWQPVPRSSLKSIFTRQQRRYISKELGIDLDITPTSLSLEQWLKLFDYFKTAANEWAIQAILGSEKRLLRQQKKSQ